MRARGGFTLVEMIVTLAVVGVAAGVTALAFGALPDAAPRPSTPEERIRAARLEVARVGAPLHLRVDSAAAEPVLVLPGGRVLGGAATDPLTGRPEAR